MWLFNVRSMLIVLIGYISVPYPVQASDITHTDDKAVSALFQSDHGPDTTDTNPDPLPQSSGRVKRQMAYFFLRLMSKDSIRAFVRTAKTETIASMLSSVGPEETLLVVSSLEEDQILRVLTSLPPASIIRLSLKMTPPQLMELLSYVPPNGLANLTASFSPEQLQQLVVLLPPEGVVKLTRALPAENTLKLVRSILPDALVNMTRSLPPDTLRDLMTSLPPQAMLPVLTSLPPQSIRELVAGLPPGFLESFVTGLSPEDLGHIVENVTDEQMVKLVTSFPVEFMPNVSSLLRPEVVTAVLESLPVDLVGNMTTMLPPRTLSSMISAVPQDMLLKVTSMVPAKQIAEMVTHIPPQSWTTLLKALPPETFNGVVASLPVDKVVNITVALADHPQAVSGILSSLMSSSDLWSNFSVFFPRELMWELLEKLPNETIGKLAATLPVKAAFEFVQSFSANLASFNVTELLTDVPKPLLSKVFTSVPPDVVANLSQQLTSSQLKKALGLVTPDILSFIVTSVPPKVIVDIAISLPESFMTKVLRVLSPQHFRNLVKAVPIATIQSLVGELLSEDRAAVFKGAFLAGTQKVANILNSVPADTVTRLVKAIPRDVLIDVIDALPADVMARGAALLAGEEGGEMLMGAVPLEVAAYAVSVIPSGSIAKMVDAIPRSTLAAFGSQATRIPQDRITRFFQLIRVGTLKTLVTRLPPRTIEKLLGSLPPRAVGRMVQSFSPVTVTPFVTSLRPRDLRRLIRSVNTTTLTNLVTSIPQDVIVNLTTALPGPQLRKLMTAVPPMVIGHLVNYLHPSALVTLVRATPPDVVDHMMTSMPTDLLVNMTRLLPPAHLQQMIDVLPGNTIGRIVSLLPPDVMAGLVQTFDPEALLGMIKKLEPAQLMDVLSRLPHQAILNLTLSLAPEQTMALLRSLPPEGVVNLTDVIPNDVMMQMMQAVPPEALLGFLTSMPLKNVFALAARLTPEQMTLALEQVTSDPDLLPNLLTAFDLDRLVSMTEAVPLDLLLQMSSRLNVVSVKEVIHRLLPKAKRLVGGLVDKGLATLAGNSSQTFSACLQDVGVVAHSMLNFSEWAFHFLDASGKPGRGMLEGNIHMIGNFDQCKRIRHVVLKGSREGEVIAGSYCHVQFDIPLEHLPPVPGEGMLPMPEIAIDLCVPDSCQDFDIFDLLKPVRLPLNVTIPRVSCQRDMDIGQDPAALAACVVLCILLLLVIVATVIDHLARRRFSSIHTSGDDDDSGKNCMYHAAVAAKPGHCNNGMSNGVSGRLNGDPNGGGRPVVSDDDDVCYNEKLLQLSDIKKSAGERTVGEMQKLMTGLPPSPVHTAFPDHSLKGQQSVGHHDNDDDASVSVSTGSDNAGRTRDVMGDGSGDVIGDDVAVRAVTVTVRAETKKVKDDEVKAVEGKGSGHDPDDRPTTDQPRWVRVVTSFSLYVTLRELLSPPAGWSQDHVTCLHGIRVLTMLWVILANTVIFSALHFENLMNAAHQLVSLPAQIVLNSSLAQDTFFLVSGVVTALSFLRSVSGSTGITARHLLHYYLHRLIRIWPAYILVVMVTACLLGYMADGPHWPPAAHAQCRQQWWANLLFVNNYFVSVEHMCMSWTWFVDSLMQFHWIAPLVLLPWALGFQVTGCVMAGLLVVVHVVSTALLEMQVNGDFLRRQSEYLWRIYQQPYCRVAPFAMGLVLGYVLTKIKFHFHIGKAATCVCWVVCVCASSLLTMVTYEENRHLLRDAAGWPLAARALHETVQRPLWGLVVSWVVFACSTGNGGPINSVLSWRGLVPFSRLTYCVYLLHPLLITADLMAYRVFAYFTLTYVVFRYVSYVVLSYALAVAVCAVSESPVRQLERVLRSAQGAVTTASPPREKA